MKRKEIFTNLIEIVREWTQDEGVLDSASESSTLLEDLKINSARFVDLILEIEDRFNVEIPDERADQIVTVGDAVDLIVSLQN